jgi:hypothetical protein
VRREETLLTTAIYRFHPDFANAGIQVWWGDPGQGFGRATVEGGDVMPVGNGVVLIGMSERTSRQGIAQVAGMDVTQTIGFFLHGLYEHNVYDGEHETLDDAHRTPAVDTRSDDLYELGGGLTWGFAPGWSLRPEVLWLRDESLHLRVFIIYLLNPYLGVAGLGGLDIVVLGVSGLDSVIIGLESASGYLITAWLSCIIACS